MQCEPVFDVGSLRAGKWARLNWKTGVVSLGRCSCHWYKKLSCGGYEGRSVKLAAWTSPQLTHFGCVPMVFCISVLHMVDHTERSWGLSTEVQWMAKRLAVKALTYRLGACFSHCMMQRHPFSICSTSRTSVPGWKVATNTGYLVINVCVALSVLVIFTTHNS